MASSAFRNDSYFANLFVYVDQIASITGLNPSIAGDANLDGVVNHADFTILSSSLDTGGLTGWDQGRL